MSKAPRASSPQIDKIDREARRAGFDDGDTAIATFDMTLTTYPHVLTQHEATLVIDALLEGRLVPKPPEPVEGAPDGGMTAEVAVSLLDKHVTVVGISGREFNFKVEKIETNRDGKPSLVGGNVAGGYSTVPLHRIASWQIRG